MRGDSFDTRGITSDSSLASSTKDNSELVLLIVSFGVCERQSVYLENTNHTQVEQEELENRRRSQERYMRVYNMTITIGKIINTHDRKEKSICILYRRLQEKRKKPTTDMLS
jgi:hypothetical protein